MSSGLFGIPVIAVAPWAADECNDEDDDRGEDAVVHDNRACSGRRELRVGI